MYDRVVDAEADCVLLRLALPQQDVATCHVDATSPRGTLATSATWTRRFYVALHLLAAPEPSGPLPIELRKLSGCVPPIDEQITCHVDAISLRGTLATSATWTPIDEQISARHTHGVTMKGQLHLDSK